MQLENHDGIAPSERVNALRMLGEYHEDWMVARDVEAAIHGCSMSRRAYMDKVQQIVFNMHINPTLCAATPSVALSPQFQR